MTYGSHDKGGAGHQAHSLSDAAEHARGRGSEGQRRKELVRWGDRRGGDRVLDRGENVHEGRKSRAWHQRPWKECSTVGDKVRQDVEEPNKLIRKRGWPLKQGCSNLHLRKVPGGAAGIS